MAIETPKYRILKKEGKFELREYEEFVTAQVQIKEDSYDRATQEGFKLLAGYIFGGNKKRTSISMTSPVVSEQSSISEKIAMTAPVQIENINKDSYIISFVMPKHYTLQSLPIPDNNMVTFKLNSSSKIAVIRFSGFVNDKTISKKTTELKKWLEKEKLKTKGKYQTARYDPPWTPWFLRRNEILIKISG